MTVVAESKKMSIAIKSVRACQIRVLATDWPLREEKEQ